MRETKFRGLSKNPVRHWHFGYLVAIDIDTGRAFIRVMDPENMPPRYTDFEVDPETVGQYTNRTSDKIDYYEGDYISGVFQTKTEDIPVRGVIAFDEYMWGISCELTGEGYSLNRISRIKLLGNIHEHPELLKP